MTNDQAGHIEVSPLSGVRHEGYCADDWISAYRRYLSKGGVVNTLVRTIGGQDFAMRFAEPIGSGDFKVVLVSAHSVMQDEHERVYFAERADMAVYLKIWPQSDFEDDLSVIDDVLTDQNSRNHGIDDKVWLRAFRTGGGLEAFASGELLCVIEVEGEFYDFSINPVPLVGGGAMLVGWAYETQIDHAGLREAVVDRIAGGAVMRVNRNATGYGELASLAVA